MEISSEIISWESEVKCRWQTITGMLIKWLVHYEKALRPLKSYVVL